jgi:hypothetical protein
MAIESMALEGLTTEGVRTRHNLPLQSARPAQPKPASETLGGRRRVLLHILFDVLATSGYVTCGICFSLRAKMWEYRIRRPLRTGSVDPDQ